MIESSYEEVHSKEWIKKNISDPSNELVIIRSLIPWDKTIKKLIKFYDQEKALSLSFKPETVSLLPEIVSITPEWIKNRIIEMTEMVE